MDASGLDVSGFALCSVGFLELKYDFPPSAALSDTSSVPTSPLGTSFFMILAAVIILCSIFSGLPIMICSPSLVSSEMLESFVMSITFSTPIL